MTNVVEPHESFEARNPDIAEEEQGRETLRRARHLALVGSAEDYEPQREFPCPGWLHITERFEGGLEVIECDVCRYLTSRHPVAARSEW